MPKVQFKTNIGSRDASALGLDFSECTIDSVMDVDNDTFASIKKLCGEGSVGIFEAKESPKAPETKKTEPADKK